MQTNKCLTIAGGVSTDNNVTALQFDCDSDPSRTWRISDVTGSGVYQIRNVQTNKCLTIAGGVSTDNNVRLFSSTATAICRAAGRSGCLQFSGDVLSEITQARSTHIKTSSSMSNVRLPRLPSVFAHRKSSASHREKRAAAFRAPHIGAMSQLSLCA